MIGANSTRDFGYHAVECRVGDGPIVESVDHDLHPIARADVGGTRFVHPHGHEPRSIRFDPQERGSRCRQIAGIGETLGDEAVEYLKKNVHPLDLAFRLAEAHGIVLLNGGGFEAPGWSLRVSLANLPDEVYEDIGRGVRAVARGYRDAYEASKGAPKK